MDYDKLLNLATEMGYRLMYSGAEIYRVEESVYRLLLAYGLEDPQVFAIPNTLVVSVTTPVGHPITRMRRIPSHGTDIELLEQCNELCRSLCFNPPPIDEAQKRVDALPKAVKTYSSAQVMIGYALAPASFTAMFGGSLRDSACALVSGLAVGLLALYGGKFIGSNGFFRTVVCSILAALTSYMMVWAGYGQDVDNIIIGVLMLLVPGIALTNAMREFMAADLVSGLSRTAEAILTAGAIALGAAMGLGLGQMIL